MTTARAVTAQVDGLVAPGFEEVRAEFEQNFAERGEIGAAVAAYWRRRAGELPLTAAASVFGAMAMELAKWWLGRETSLSARDMDARFHELVWRGLGDRRPPAT